MNRELSYQKRLFILVAVFGTLVRGFVAWKFHTRAWIDEIWVVLQPAYRLIHHVGPIERDWVWQVRDWIVPLFFSGLMKIASFPNGETAHQTLRIIVSTITSFSIIVFTVFLKKLFKLQRDAWLTLLVLFFTPDFIFYSATFDLSVIGLPFLLVGTALVLSSDDNLNPSGRFRVGAILTSLSALIRFQYGVFAFIYLLGFIFKRQKRKALELFIIGVLTLIFDALLNSYMYGNPVLPIYNYFMVNTTGGVAASYGVTPFYFAFELLWKFATEPVFLLFLFFVTTSLRIEKTFTLATVLFFVLHMIVGHKEYRFFYAAAFTIASLSTINFEKWCFEKKHTTALLVFLILFAAFGIFRASKKVDWHAFEIPAKLEMKAGKDLRTTGLLTVGWGGIYQGCNVIYYQPLPCFFYENLDQFHQSKQDFTHVSHLVLPANLASPCSEKIYEERGGALYYCTKEELKKL